MSLRRTSLPPPPARAASFLGVPRETWLLAAIIGAGAAIRFATLGHQSYDHDEAVTAWRVLHGGLGHTLDAVVSSERSRVAELRTRDGDGGKHGHRGERAEAPHAHTPSRRTRGARGPHDCIFTAPDEKHLNAGAVFVLRVPVG